MANEVIIEGAKRIIELEERGGIGSGAYVAVDDASAGTKKYKLQNILDEIPEIDVDYELSDTSENPVQNKVITGAVDSLSQDKADIIITSASGSIAHIEDAGAYPVKELTVYIEPVQAGSGDPSPDNVRPISGHAGANVVRTGRNLIENTGTGRTNSNVEYTVNSDGSVTAVGLANATSWWRPGTTSDDWKYIKAGTYKLSGGISNDKMLYLVGEYVDGVRLSNSTVTGGIYDKGLGLTLTLTKDAYINYQIQINNGQNANDTFYLMIQNASDTDTTWEQYRGHTLPITWQSEAGTVYGGYVDVTQGKLVVTDANIASYSGETLPSTWISDRDVYAEGTTPTTGAQVVYKLATPIEYDITPQQISTLLGMNNVWTDTGDTDVEYRADTKLYIEQLTKPTEDDMTANTTIASGKFFMVGNRLFLSTATIASGDTINPGTNCTELSLADALNSF